MQSYADIQKQISDLQRQAESARKAEISAAVKEVKRLISVYGLNASDVGLATTPAKANKKGKAVKPAKKVAGKSAKASKKSSGDKRASVAPKYRDPETGNTWTGRGKPPTWLAAKLASGATKDQFKI